MQKNKIKYLSVFVFVVLIGFFIFYSGSISNLIDISAIFRITSSSLSAQKPKLTIDDKVVYIEIADTPEKRASGLSGKKSLGKNDGMLFVFDKKTIPAFWMKDMNFAIDIIWIADGKVVGIDKNVQPQPGHSLVELQRYIPPAPVDHVLEVSAGFCDENGIRTDSTAEI